jgi:chitin synthase
MPGEVKIHNTKAVVEKAPTFQLRRTDMVEDRFWTTMAEGVLKPELSVANNDTDELKEKLKGLRNNTVVAMLVINVLWLALLLSFNLQYLERFGIIQSALPALFAVLYFGILAVQFVCLIVHRIETMVHVLART